MYFYFVFMDDLIERERALAASVATDARTEAPKRRKGRWDKGPSGEDTVQATIPHENFSATAISTMVRTPVDLQARLLEAHRSIVLNSTVAHSGTGHDKFSTQGTGETPHRKCQDQLIPSVRHAGEALFAEASLMKKSRWDVATGVGDQHRSERNGVFTVEMLSRLDPDLPAMRTEDMAYFSCLFHSPVSETADTKVQVARLLLKIKNGSSTVRRQAVRELCEEAPSICAGPILDLMLPLLTGAPLDTVERHSISNALCQVVTKLGWKSIDKHLHRVLVAIEPMLMAEDSHSRAEGRAVISSLANISGIGNILSVLQYDTISSDEYVRGVTARILAILVSVDAKSQVLEYIRDLCIQPGETHMLSRLTGLRAISFLAQFSGLAVLPHLAFLVRECIAPAAANKPSHITHPSRSCLFTVLDIPELRLSRNLGAVWHTRRTLSAAASALLRELPEPSE